MFWRAPIETKALVSVIALIALGFAFNWVHHTVRKPSELFFPVSETLHKTPAETWRAYAPLFKEYSTRVITPDLLAALAQIEGSGNPVVRTYWRWSNSNDPLKIYRPASSAVGMYQITDGTLAEASRYCIRDHIAVEDKPGPDSCWANKFYSRTVPAHAVELTSAYLDRSVEHALQRHGIRSATLQQKQNLATVIHLCGAGAGRQYAARKLQLRPQQRCGDHSAAGYIAKINSMKAVFRRLEKEI